MKLCTLLRALLATFVIAMSVVPGAVRARTYDFGSLFSGSFAPSSSASSFAQLSVTPAGFNVFNFSVRSNDLNAIFTPGAFIGAIAVNTDQVVSAGNVSISNFIGYGVDGVSVKSGPGGTWDFVLSPGPGGSGSRSTLGANESASWTATISNATQVQFAGKQFVMHVEGLTGSQGGSAWYSPSPHASAAPEPEIYAMMLSGLLLVGFARRRRAALAS